jgi:DNA-binding transcriptional LysR family regulator
MHLRNVEIFCDVVALRSFSKAAEVHNVSQSSASQSVHMLEKRLGSQLIDRSKRPLELTPAGQVYYDGCRDLLDSFRKIEDRVQQMKNKVVGRLRIAAIYSVGLSQMEAYVKRFEELYPDVELHLEYLHPDEVYDRVLSDEADLGLVSFPRDGGEISSIDWQEQEMVVVVAPTHRLAGRDSIDTADLDGEEFVGFTTELTIRKNIDRWLKQQKVTANVVVEFDNIETDDQAGRRNRFGLGDFAPPHGRPGSRHRDAASHNAQRCVLVAAAGDCAPAPQDALGCCEQVGRAPSQGSGDISQQRQTTSQSGRSAIEWKRLFQRQWPAQSRAEKTRRKMIPIKQLRIDKRARSGGRVPI